MVTIDFNFSKKKYKQIVNDNVSKKHLSRYIQKQCGNKSTYISYNFVTSKEQIKINKEFKQHNYNTDIITFPILNNECELTADVYISLKQVYKNAERYDEKIFSELNRVIIHGFLHLIGYNDDTKEEQKIMRKQENHFIKHITEKRSTWNNSIYHY